MNLRKFILAALLLLCALPAWSRPPKLKVEWGVIGGVNITDFSTKFENTDIKNKLGWQLGIITAVNFGAVAIEPQILYVRQGLRIRQANFPEVNLRSNSIDVPVLFSLRILRPLRFNIGPVFTVMNDCKQKSGSDLLNFGRVRPTVSYSIGAGVVILRHLLLDLRYNGQFGSKKDVVVAEGQTLNLRSYNVAFSAGYFF